MNRKSSLERRDVKYTYNRKNEKKHKEKQLTVPSKKSKLSTDLANNDDFSSTQSPSASLQEGILESEKLLTATPHFSNEANQNAYIAELLRTKTVVPLNDEFTAFCMQNWNKNKLQANHFVIIIRRLMSFNGIRRWVFTCDCNPARMKLIQGLENSVFQHYSEVFTNNLAECLHIETLQQLLQEFDEETQISTEMDEHQDHIYYKSHEETRVFSIPNHDSTVCVYTGDYGIVEFSQKASELIMSCKKCRVKNCMHIQGLKELFKVESEDSVINSLKKKFTGECKFQDIKIQTSYSKEKIPFDQSCTKPCDRQSALTDHISHCDCGGSLCEEMASQNVVLVLPEKVCEVTVMKKVCEKCLKSLTYDGQQDRILNMGTYLVHHAVLRDYMRCFLTEGTTMFSYYKMLKWKHVDSHSILDVFSYTRFRAAWYSFVDLLDIEYASGFCCPECGEQPETVIMDGITLGFKEIHLPWFNFLENKLEPATLDGSMHADRVFIQNTQARQMVAKFASPHSKGASEKEMIELKKTLKLYRPCLISLIEETIEEDKNGLYLPTKNIQKFLFALAKDSPLCGLVHYSDSIIEILTDLAQGKIIKNDASKMKSLMEEFPSCFDVISTCSNLPDYLQPVFQDIIKVIQKTFEKPTHQLPHCTNPDNLAFFPALTQIVERGKYIQDNQNVSKEFTSECEKFKFLKRKKGHPTLTPGIFTVLCTHGVCYGFRIMENAESPNVPFTLLRTRFQKAPRYIIYDNACHLMSYCLNRDPSFFKDSWFLVDRFHWKNHKGCSEGFCISRYPHLQLLNSQAAEQRNSYLKKLKPMLSYMNFHSFTTHLKLFSWFISMCNISKISIDDSQQYIYYFKKICS